MPTFKGVHPQPITLRTWARTATQDTNATPTASLNPTLNAPLAQQTCSHTLAANSVSPHNCSSRIYPHALMALWDMPILDKTTGQLLNYQKFQNHPTLANTWNTSFSDEMGRLFQGVGLGSDVKGKRVNRAETFHVIRYKDTRPSSAEGNNIHINCIRGPPPKEVL